ncbi:MAG: regulatory protein RecX [Bacteroidales bacterium]|nr:regulatory protein RecX [Bacteroidales bacterium]
MSGHGNGTELDFGQAYRKAADFCVIQDRCVSELQLKFIGWGIDRSYTANIISKLIEEGFIDEKRFAFNYAGGKFRINGWGKLKIAASLRARNIPALLIQQALSSFQMDEYTSFLSTLLQKKLRQLGGDTNQNRQKAVFFAASRGFEQGLITEFLHDIDLSDF